MDRLAQAWGKDFLRALIIRGLAVVVVVPLGCALILLPLGLVNNLPLDDTGVLLVLAVPLGLFFLLTMGGGLALAAIIVRRRTDWLDDAFVPLGLDGGAYLLSGRRYRGQVAGRAVEARFFRGPTLNLTVATPLQTRFSAAVRSDVGLKLARAFKREPVALGDPDLGDLSVFALDEAWARALLAEEAARAALLRLLTGESDFVLHQVHLRPGQFVLTLYRNRGLFTFAITPAQARQWLDDLLALARVAEGLPAPAVTAEATKLERFVATGTGTRPVTILAIVAVVMVLCVFVPAMVVVAGFLLANSGVNGG